MRKRAGVSPGKESSLGGHTRGGGRPGWAARSSAWAGWPSCLRWKERRGPRALGDLPALHSAWLSLSRTPGPVLDPWSTKRTKHGQKGWKLQLCGLESLENRPEMRLNDHPLGHEGLFQKDHDQRSPIPRQQDKQTGPRQRGRKGQGDDSDQRKKTISPQVLKAGETLIVWLRSRLEGHL